MARIGLQLYSIKEISSIDFLGAIRLAANSGYEGIEFAGFFDTPAEDLVKCMEENNIVPCGSHTSIDLLESNFDATVEYNQAIGNKYIIVPWIPEEMRNSRIAWLETAKRFNELNARLKENGIRFGYHNHAFEFEKYDGSYGFDIFAENTDSDLLLEIDLYWVEYPGLSAVEYTKKYKDRLELLHIKDIADDKTSTEIGSGNIDWHKVAEEAEETDWFIVEQEHFTIPQEESIAMSCRYLKELL